MSDSSSRPRKFVDRRLLRWWGSFILVFWPGLTLAVEDQGKGNDDGVKRAIRFLAAEVQTWSKEKQCASCHNTGDAMRALAIAHRRGYRVQLEKISAALQWLRQPGNWANNKGDQRFNDVQLSELQFGGALLEATRSRLLTGKGIRPEEALKTAARLIAKHQKADGRWQIVAPGTIGSPITYGRFLATASAREILRAAEAGREPRVAKADRWLRSTPAKSVLDAAGQLFALCRAKDKAALASRQRALVVIRRGRDKTGGWGPFVTSQPEVFDTAVVVIALSRLKTATSPERVMLRGGRQFLVAQQLADGSWPETTRPAENDSYAHRISTTAWATIALIESSGAVKKRADR